jgi:uncharacterized damage-inducible protein DinB
MQLYDLNPTPGMTPTIGLLHATVTHNYLRLKRIVAGLTQEEIDFKGPQDEWNSIAQLLRHLTVIDLHWVFRLQSSEVAAELQTRFGPMRDKDGKLPTVKNISLTTLLEEYDQIQEMMREVCLNKTDADLSQVVSFEKGKIATVRWGIWHIADHSRYHQAHIGRMIKLARDL